MANRCGLLVETGGGGGNLRSGSSGLIVRRHAAIGDVIAATCVADKLSDLGIQVTWQAHSNIHCVLRRHYHISHIMETGGMCHIDLDGAYEQNPNRRARHFSDMFIERANDYIRHLGLDLGQARNCRPSLHVHPMAMSAWSNFFGAHPRPWVFICPRSDSYNVRQVPDGIWQETARLTHGTKFWLGRHPAPPGIVDCKFQHLDNVIDSLAVADLLISVDTGPMHIAAALGVPVVALCQSSSPELHLSDQRDFITISPALDCLNCQLNVCPKNPHLPPCQQIDPEIISAWANAKLRAREHDDVSVVIPIYRPPAERLNRCIEAVVNQAREVLVTCDGSGVIPPGALKHSKVRYVKHWRHEIGYGRNVNFGVRHTYGRWLWIINDDFFAEPDCLKNLMACANPGVGLVGHLLRYPDGRIQHGGKFRNPGMRGWGHIDQGNRDSTVPGPMEMENVTGASILVRRQAFYEIGGNDEDFLFYAVDDAMCLSLRQRGWKIIFTPHAVGTHEEAATSRTTGRIAEFVNQGNGAFERKWGWWITKNLNTIPGKF